jgi:hypothetical protein
MVALFCKDCNGRLDAHGRSLLDGRSWTLIIGWTLMDDRTQMTLDGRWLVAGRMLVGHIWTILVVRKILSCDGHGTVTVTLQKHKKYCKLILLETKKFTELTAKSNNNPQKKTGCFH